MRRPQFSLRSLFVLLTIVAIVVLWSRDRLRIKQLEARLRLAGKIQKEIGVQQQRVKQRELELLSAKNQVRPQLDFIAMYRWTGASVQQPGSPGKNLSLDDVTESLMNGDPASLENGFDMVAPVGFRRELAAIRQAELRLAREQADLDLVEQKLKRMTAERKQDDDWRK